MEDKEFTNTPPLEAKQRRVNGSEEQFIQGKKAEQEITREQLASLSSSSSSHDDAALVTASNNNTTTTGSSGEDRCSGSINDDYGLPVPVDDRVRENTAAHAAVVARLPPPEMSASSFFSSLSEKTSSNGEVQYKHKELECGKTLFSSDQSYTSDGLYEKKRKKRPLYTLSSPSRKRQIQEVDDPEASNEENNSSGSGSEGEYNGETNSSGSGTEGGYNGGSSFNDKPSSCSSPSISSGEERGHTSKLKRGSSPSSSSIADYDESSDPPNGSSDSQVFESSSNGDSSEEQDDDDVPRKLDSSELKIVARSKVNNHSLLHRNYQNAMFDLKASHLAESTLLKPNISRTTTLNFKTKNNKPNIFIMSCDIMAHCMSFLEPPEVHELLTTPLSKEWRLTYTIPRDLWRVLCLTEPFKAKFEAGENDSDDCTFPLQSEEEVKHLLGKYRLLYTSFVRCTKYLARIKEDAIFGRPPSVIEYGRNGEFPPASLRTNENLKTFLARARSVIVKNKRKRCASNKRGDHSHGSPIGVTDENSSVQSSSKRVAAKMKSFKSKRPRYGHSTLTQRLLGPSKTGEAGNINLPWSCAIYSIVNWMVAFTDVEGIQIMCLKVLPFLLEDEGQRTTAQRAGLTDIVLRGMVLFPTSVKLHTAAFHTIVLLARPLGGKEGMLFHCSMVNSTGIFNGGSQSGKNGIAIMLESMKLFESDVVLQAMSCWSLVNIALAPSQKAVLVKLGGISVVANAMMQHQFNAEVQFRALFALINLVIPSVNTNDADDATAKENKPLQSDIGEASEREMLDNSVGQIANLVVVAMKNFCSSESIVNRACLVLHNLSLTEDYHIPLLWTPNCYQMLEWCLANYRTDQVLQQSAAGTLHRLQTTLSNNEKIRQQFTSSLQSQQQSSLEESHREALLMHEEEERLRASQR